MNCPYCRASNVPDEHRCQRCGRRLDSTEVARPAYGREATARALQFEVAPEPRDRERAPSPYQPSLFSTRIVSFESYAPESVEPKRSRTGRPKSRQKREIAGQESFDFETVITHAQTVRTTVDLGVMCDCPVAVPAHRLIAAAIDFSIITISLALFFLIFHVAGGQVVLNPKTLPLCIAMAAIFYLLYELLWCMADTDTAGMRWARLRVVNFEGRSPDREQRMVRLASGCLSMLAAGLGVLWALVDEESLAWHDHISKTFPTPE
jgi:uncharacterized RDD family membrane protein YckC